MKLPLLEIQLQEGIQQEGAGVFRAPMARTVDIAPEVLLVLAGAGSAVLGGLVGWLYWLHQRTQGTAPSPELEAPPRSAVYSTWQLVALTSPTLAYSCTATTLAFMLLPDEARVFPYESSWTLGLLYAVGALAELPGPLLGHLSDCLCTPFGRRRPLIAVAATLVVVATAVQWLGAIHKSLHVFCLSLLVHMVGWALLYTAQQGLVLDVLQPNQLSLASSCQAVFIAVGACFAFLAAVALPPPLHYHYQYAVTSLLTVVTSLCAILTAHEQPATGVDVAESTTSLYGLFKRYYMLDFTRQRDFSLVMVCKALMYGGGVAKGYLVYFLRDTWNVTDTWKLHLKVASIAISAEACAGVIAGLFMLMDGVIGPNRAAVYGASIIALSWCVMIPLGFWDQGWYWTELFALVYGVGHGLVLFGDQALTYHMIPEKAHGSRSFGMQSVAAFAGMSAFAFLCSLVLDLFGHASLGRTLPGPRAGPIPTDGYRLEGYVALFVFVTAMNLFWAYVYSLIRKVDVGDSEAAKHLRTCCGTAEGESDPLAAA